MRPLQIALALSVTLAGLALSSGSADAHARYERSEPQDGAVLAESPSRVDVWFSQEVRRSGGLPAMTVVSETGDILNDDGSVLDDTDRTHVFAEIPPALPDGRYTVIWHTLSDEDGEEAQGAFHFFVGQDAGTVTPPAGETPGPTPPTGETPEPSTGGPTPAATVTPEPTPPADDDGGDVSTGTAVSIAVVLAVVGVIVGGGIGWLIARRR